MCTSIAAGGFRCSAHITERKNNTLFNALMDTSPATSDTYRKAAGAILEQDATHTGQVELEERLSHMSNRPMSPAKQLLMDRLEAGKARKQANIERQAAFKEQAKRLNELEANSDTTPEELNTAIKSFEKTLMTTNTAKGDRVKLKSSDVKAELDHYVSMKPWNRNFAETEEFAGEDSASYRQSEALAFKAWKSINSNIEQDDPTKINDRAEARLEAIKNLPIPMKALAGQYLISRVADERDRELVELKKRISALQRDNHLLQEVRQKQVADAFRQSAEPRREAVANSSVQERLKGFWKKIEQKIPNKIVDMK